MVHPSVTFVGVGVQDDVYKLQQEHGLVCSASAMKDIQEMAMARHPLEFIRRPGLKDLASWFVGLNMSKPIHVCRSNWEARDLSLDQIEYACIDAYASYRIGRNCVALEFCWVFLVNNSKNFRALFISWRLVGGILGYNKSAESEPSIKADAISAGGLVEDPHETTALLADNNPGQQPCQGPLPLAEKDHEKERRKAGKVKKAPKPPRPPKGPSLDAADMRLIKEISKIAMKKRERIERLKAYKKMKATRLPPPLLLLLLIVCIFTIFWWHYIGHGHHNSLYSCSNLPRDYVAVDLNVSKNKPGMGLGSLGSSNLALAEAPQPAPETTDLSPIQLYKTVMSDDGAAPIFLPPKSNK
ncbi:UNVERIFIED_CONTAM: hypothetical protein Sangu_0474400 [Sesamum angustifolium]|uniref:3'-5' exonuclease domain-containing protein n=1 Tax=Sesamum angustifolium TaxID=2727405 RepID=A0AAW2QUZ0_9LAMI